MNNMGYINVNMKLILDHNVSQLAQTFEQYCYRSIGYYANQSTFWTWKMSNAVGTCYM